jgi:MFS family permease
MAGARMAAPLYTLRTGFGEWAVGPLLALFAFAPVLLALPAGRLADRVGYHAPVRLAVALGLAGPLAAVAATRASALRYPLLCLAALACGAGCNLGLIAIQRTAGRTAHGATELRRVFSWLGIAPSISNVVGPLGAGLLIDHVGFGAAFAALATLPLGALVFARWVPREAPRTPQGQGQPRRGAWDLLATPILRRLLLINWFMSTAWDVHSFVVPVLGHERGFSASAIGTVLGSFAFAVTGVRLLIPLFASRLREATVLALAMGIVAIVLAVYPFASALWSMASCAVVLGFALGASQPMVMTAIHQVTPRERHGEAIALRSMALNFSGALMPLGFAALGATLGAAGLFWSMGVLVAAGGLLLTRKLQIAN